MNTAQTGRTHDLHPTASRKPKKSLDPWAPSTHDPTRTSASISCCSSEASFCPYQSPRLSRYDASSRTLGADMRRREFIAVLAASSAWQLGARAASAPRSDKIHRIGMLRIGYPPPTFLAPFRNGLHELGLVEGQNIFIEYGIGRSVEELPKLANDLIGLQVELLLASGTPAVIPAKNATTSVPIVFVAAIDPIATGLVQSLSRPGGNITGLTALFTDLMGKRLEFLQEAFPSISRVALISHINNPGHEQYVREAERAAKLLGITLQTLAVRGPEEFEQAFRGAQGAGAVLQIDDAMLTAHRVKLVELAMKYKIPGIYGFRGSLTLAASWHSARAIRICTTGPQPMLIRSSAAPSRPTFRLSNRPSSK